MSRENLSLVQHKPGCTATVEDWRLEILDKEVDRFYYLHVCSKNKGADEL